jgi:hypothetical protein
MTPHEMIESYVHEVARRLPRKLRNDVAFELRDLLADELQAKADAAGGAPDEAMALTLLNAFGRPADVADRYRPASFVIIPASQTRGFALTALIGVALQWALTLPPVFNQPEAFPGQNLSRLGAWWTSWGLGAFWLPGVLVVIAIVAQWIAHRWPRPDAWAPRPVIVDRDRVRRPLLLLGLVGWALAAGLWIAMPSYGPHLPGVLPRVFAFDDTFLRDRASWLLPIWAGHFGVYVAAFVQGRWTRLTRRLDLAFGLAISVLLAWFVAAGPVFAAKATDDAAKAITALVVALSLIATAVTLYRARHRLHAPKGLAAGA